MNLQRRTFRNLSLAAASAIAVMTSTNAANAQQDQLPTPEAAAIQFSIPAQPLSAALMEFSRQAHVTVVAPSEIVRDRQSNAVMGEMSPEEALSHLIAGSDLRIQQTSDGGLTLVVASAESPTQLGDARPAAPSEALVEEEIVVTGTNIRGVAPAGSPVTIYDREDIDRSGVGTVDRFLRTVPQNFVQVDATTAVGNPRPDENAENPTRGTGINLHGLGAGSTLVLLNGRRLAPAGLDGAFIDVSMIPLGAVERVEVLTDGASAIYGADAVAGVVNIVLRRDFEGAETTLRYGDTTDGGGREYNISQLLGASWESGNAMLTLSHRDQSPLRAEQRDFIPDQGGSAFILPDQTMPAVLGSVRQYVSPSVDVFGDGYYTEREFIQDFAGGLGTTQSHTEGSARQTGGVFGAGVEFGDDWRAEFSSNYSKLEERVTNVSNTLGTIFSQTTDTTSELLSVDLRADGSLFPMPGGRARASIGAGFRTEKFDDFGIGGSGVGLQREVGSVYGEVFAPLASEMNPQPWARRLELSLAVRYDHYDDFGPSTNPKFGLLWSPVSGVNLRGTYGESFRAPTLSQLSSVNQSYFLFPLPDPNAADGMTNTIVWSAPGNPALRPEIAKSRTAGFDLKPEAIAGLSISVTYFDVDYTDRVASPPLTGGIFNIYSQVATLAPFIDLSPDPMLVNDLFAQNAVVDPLGLGPSSVEAIFDLRLQNIAASRASGVDFSGSYEVSAPIGQLGFFLGGSYLAELDFQAVQTAPFVQLVDKLYTPADLKLRGGVSWSRGAFGSSLMVNYTDDYENDFAVPSERVDSWTTFDLQLSYQSPATSSPFGGLGITLSALNITDEDPPFVSGAGQIVNLGYDPSNASPLGRFLALQVTKRW